MKQDRQSQCTECGSTFMPRRPQPEDMLDWLQL